MPALSCTASTSNSKYSLVTPGMRSPAPGAFVTTDPSTGDCAGPAETVPSVVSPFCRGGSAKESDCELAIVSAGTVTVLDR
jgi:hypothetical protein